MVAEKAAAERANAAENKRFLTPVCEPAAFATRSGLIPLPEGIEPKEPVSKEFEDLNGDGWNDTLDKLRDAISIITGDEGPEFEQLIKRVRVECST